MPADRPRENEVLSRLEAWGAERSWVGPDPYEGLNTALGRIAPGVRGKQAVVQAYKRLPHSPPWPLRATPRPNSKALALALSGYAARPEGFPAAKRFLDELPRELERMSISSGDAVAWGYHFDAQTRHLFYSSQTPNAVATCFVVEALLEAHGATGRAAPATLALRARPYLRSLLRRDVPPGPFFAYVATGSELIHNANLLVGACLARLHELEPDRETEVAFVRAPVETTLRLQRDDGLWRYGERADLGWVDSFHTAYVLESLTHLERVLGIGGEELVTGLSAWRERFFGRDGRAFFHPDREFPLEAHSYASAIDCLCAVSSAQLGEDPEMLATRIADSAIRELWLQDEGRFAFKRTRHGLNRRSYMRWTNAPMFRALCRLAARAGASSPAPAVAIRAGGD